jgi:hypothetical protein
MSVRWWTNESPLEKDLLGKGRQELARWNANIAEGLLAPAVQLNKALWEWLCKGVSNSITCSPHPVVLLSKILPVKHAGS